MNGPFLFGELIELTGDQPGTHDVACPHCGPQRRAIANRRRRVLRIWHPEPGFFTFFCPRCGIKGYAIDNGRKPVSRVVIERARAEQEALEHETAAKRLATARRLWRSRRPIAGTIAETYLRKAREISGPLPATLGFLPAWRECPPALIAAFGIPAEPEPGALVIPHTAIAGVHITRLLLDGSGKDERRGPAKIMIGRSSGWPIVLAPVNDSGGLGITEGIEDGLTVRVTGLGMWVAGSASRLTALAERIPSYVNCITIFADGDTDGMRHARELERLLRARRLFTTLAKIPETFR